METIKMVEILFSESACCGLIEAQNYGKGTFRPGAVSIFTDKKISKKERHDFEREFMEKERINWEQAVPLGGNSKDVFCFNLLLSIGDISGNCTGERRFLEISKLYDIYPDGTCAAKDIISKSSKNLRAVKERINSGEDIRIWYSNQPDELCGLCWFITQIQDHKGRLFIIKLPGWELQHQGLITHTQGWGEIHPGAWHKFVKLQKEASSLFCRTCVSLWKNLSNENSPLRAVVNGNLVSIPETFYDSFILEEIKKAKDEFQEAKIVGTVLGKYKLGISDAWVAHRIESMINEGTLQLVSNPENNLPAYYRILRKNFAH
jgi:hypothetical protein